MSALVDEVAAFARAHVAGRRDLWRTEHFPPDLWRAFADADLLGLGIAERWGGRAIEATEMLASAEALVRHGRSIGVAKTWQAHLTQDRFLVERHADEAQAAAILPRLAGGETTTAVAISEPGAGAHPKKLSTRARRDGDEWVITGEKAYVTNGPIAGIFIVLAVSAEDAGRKRFSAFLVPRESEGLSLAGDGGVDWLRPAGHCALLLDAVRVPAGALLGAEGEAYDAIGRPLRDHEDLLGLGARFGGMAAEIDALARAAVEAESLGRLEVALDALRALAHLALAADAERAGRLLLDIRRRMADFQDEVGALLETSQIEFDPVMAALRHDLTKLGGVAGYVQSIRLRRIGEAPQSR